jgi:hypothetical protein
MGGRWYYHKKATVEASCDLSIFRLNKMGMLAGRRSIPITWASTMTGKETTIFLTADVTGDPHVQLEYTISDSTGNTQDYDYQVSLLTSHCNLGGIRYWFACPECLEKVATIYLTPGDVLFRCRHCNNLTYRSRNRCLIESFGHTSRQIEKLRSEIRRWTWGNRPTRKVRRLCALEGKMVVFSPQISAQMDKLRRPYLK